MTELALRLVFSLAAVVGLLLLVAKFAQKRFQGHTGAPIQVVHRQQLSRGAAVSVVTVGPRVLVLGMTEHQVTVLTELDPDELALVSADDAAVDDVIGTAPEPGARRVQAAGPATALTPTPRSPQTLPRRTPTAANGSHRAAGPVDGGPLAGSVLSAQTWRQALAAVSGRKSA